MSDNDDQTPDALYKDRWTVPADGADSSNDPEPPLPHVEPPSAGFIVQLFVVPAIIVMVVIGVYLLFSRLASGEADWRQLVTDVRSENIHVRWRSALTLAQVLQDDALRQEQGQKLAINPEVATALTEMLANLLKKANPTEEEAQHTEFMLKAVGLLDVPATTLPPLLAATEEPRDRELRKQALNSLAQVCGRAFQQGQPLTNADLVARIIAISKDSELLFRHQATFILGTLTTPDAQSRLGDLLGDSDLMTRVNAAVGFARQKSTRGLPVLEALFEDAAEWELSPQSGATDQVVVEQFERAMLVKNGMRAVQDLAPQLDATTRQRLLPKMARFADKAEEIGVRSQWVETKAALAK